MRFEPVIEFLAQKIDEAYRTESFIGIIVYGAQGVGKSVFALTLSFAVYRRWKDVFDTLVFTLDDLYNLLLTTSKRLKCIVGDDAGVQLMDKYKYRYDLTATAWINAIIQLARTKTASLILTTPSPRLLAKSVRDQPDWLWVYMMPEREREAWPKMARVRIYSISFFPPDNIVPGKLYDEGLFTVYLPDRIYRRYKPLRKRYVDIATELFDFKAGKED